MTTNNYEILADTALSILRLKFTEQLVNEGCSQEMAHEFFDWYLEQTNFKQLYKEAFAYEFTIEEIEEIVKYQHRYLNRILALDTELTTKSLSGVNPQDVQSKLEELWEKYNAA